MMKFWVQRVVIVVVCGFIGAGCNKSGNPKGDAAKKGEKNAAAAPQQNIEPILLKVKWPVGNRYTQRMNVTSSSEMTMPQSPKPVAQEVKMEQEYALEVAREREKGGRELNLEFLSTEMEVKSAGKVVMNVDTKGEAGAAEASDSLAASYRQLVGAKIKYHLNERNMVEKIEGLKEFVDKATSKAPAQGKATMRSMFNEDYFKQIVEFGKHFPSKPVKPGDSWPVKTQIAMGPLGFVVADLNYTFKGLEQHEKRNCAAIDFTGTLTSKPPTNGAAPAATTMNLEKGTMSGKTWFDPDLGMVVDLAMDQDLMMKVTYTVGSRPRAQMSGYRTNAPQPAPQPPVQQTANSHTKQKVNIKLVDFSGGAN
jgi:hypothetical protein